MADDDDDFEDLFSFGTSTPGAPSSDTAKGAPTSTGSNDFDLLSDVSLSTTPGTGAGLTLTPGASASGRVTPTNATASTAAGAVPSLPTPKSSSSGIGDEFDALFGTPPATPATPRTPINLSSAEDRNSLLAIDEMDTPPNNHDGAAAVSAMRPSFENKLSSMDDFHVHDEDTRDMLDWLDDDTAGMKKVEPTIDISLDDSGDEGNVPTTGEDKVADGGEFGDDDDFDFDQMLAEADSNPKNVSTADKVVKTNNVQKETASTAVPSQQIQQSSAEAVADKVSTAIEDGRKDEPKVVPETTPGISSSPKPVMDDSLSPEENSRPSVSSATVEKELAFDEWEDDEAMEDLQLTSDFRNATQDQSTANAVTEGGATADTQKDGVGASSSTPATSAPAVVKPPSPKKIVFSSLSDAIRSNASTLDDVRSLFKKEHGIHNVNGDVGVSKDDRAHLWTKVICNKTLQDIEDGSLSDSYREWAKNKGDEVLKKMEEGEEYGAIIDSLLKQACGINPGDAAYESKKRELISLSYFHSRNSNHASDDIDPLISPVALAILQAGIPSAAASLVLSQIEPASMPLMRLSQEERFIAAKALHTDFYLLACYHLPLLVMHLDRHCAGWYWPKMNNKCNVDEVEQGATVNTEKADANDGEKQVGGATSDTLEDGGAEVKTPAGSAEKTQPEKKMKGDLEQNGLLPISWFVTNFAGDCGSSDLCLEHDSLLPLWDNLLTKGDHSIKYFLAISVLEKNSDALLMSRGDELKQELERILNFQETSFVVESFVGASDGNATSIANNDDGMVTEWLVSAKSLIEATPSSALELLRSADDRAVASLLKVRQSKMDEKLQAQLDADEAARKKEREERDKEAEKALNKARLSAYYRQYNPDKLDTIDQIMKLFDGRMGVLDEKLKRKYGKGFLPEDALKDQTRSFLMSVNQSITETRKHVTVAVAERRKKKAKSTADNRPSPKVVLEVSTTEVIPLICTTKGHDLATGKKISISKRTSDTDAPLQFYLVDCRPESIAAEQGRFPTAVTLSPEKLQDPDGLQKLTDLFESLRGACHICVMGEGFASFPVLYNHSLSIAEQKLLEDDVARTSNCALFFLKKGFPFVSILRGGFAAAHAFLSRKGMEMGMTPPEVLVDYDSSISLFSMLEAACQEEEHYKNAPAREKTSRTLQKIIDNSMTRLTMEEQRINALANDLAKPETVDKMKESASALLAKAKAAKPKSMPTMTFGRTPPLFMAKKFTTTKLDGESEKKDEASEDGDKNKPSTTSFTEKINFKMPSLHSASSGVGSDKGESKSDEKEDSTNPGEDTSKPPDSVSASNAAEVEEVKSDSPSKMMSSALASFSQRIQQTTTSAASSGDARQTAFDGEPVKTDCGISVSKINFSNFTSRMKMSQQPVDKPPAASPPTASEDTEMATEGSQEQSPPALEKPIEPSLEKDGIGTSTDSTSKMSSSFASFTQRMKQSTASAEGSSTGVSKMSLSSFRMKQPTAPAEGGKMSLSSFKMKFSQHSTTSQPMKPPASKQETELAESKDEAASENTAEEKIEAEFEAENTEEEPKADAAPNTPADEGRFASFSKTVSGKVTELKMKAAEIKISEEKKAAVPEEGKEESKSVPSTSAPDEGGTFTSFTKSFGGKVSELRSQMSTKTEPTLTSFGKLLLEDEPRPMTRFQRLDKELDVEELVSFDDDTDDASTPSGSHDVADNQADDLLFADVSLTDADESPKPDKSEASATDVAKVSTPDENQAGVAVATDTVQVPTPTSEEAKDTQVETA